MRSALIVVSTNATTSSSRRPGSVTAKNSRTAPAPSTRAASYSDVGIFWMPARNSTMHRPNVTHVPIEPTARSAQSKSPSQPRATSSRADRVERRVERALRRVDPHERLRDHDAGDRLRQEQHGPEEREAAHAADGS